MATKLVSDELLELMELVKGADSIELKLTVPETSYRSAAAALGLDPLEAQIRQVFFFDTPELTLNHAGVVARARRIQGRESDSVVKLRPVVPAELPGRLRRSPNFVVEVDAMPGGYVCSARHRRMMGADRVKASIMGERPLRKLFSGQQRRFLAEHVPDVAFEDLRVLGPIFVLKLRFSPPALDRRIVAELWLYPDDSRILELATKCAPSEAFQTAAECRAFLEDAGLDLAGEQATKTRRALELLTG